MWWIPRKSGRRGGSPDCPPKVAKRLLTRPRTNWRFLLNPESYLRSPTLTKGLIFFHFLNPIPLITIKSSTRLNGPFFSR